MVVVACFVLNGWLCGVRVLLCFCSSFNCFVVLFLYIWFGCKCDKHVCFFPVFCAYLAGLVLLFGFGRFSVGRGPFLFLISFYFLLVFCFVILVSLYVWELFFWRVLGEVRPEGPAHLILSLPGFFSFLCGKVRVR